MLFLDAMSKIFLDEPRLLLLDFVFFILQFVEAHQKDVTEWENVWLMWILNFFPQI